MTRLFIALVLVLAIAANGIQQPAAQPTTSLQRREKPTHRAQ